jgi:hypothetical protein
MRGNPAVARIVSDETERDILAAARSLGHSTKKRLAGHTTAGKPDMRLKINKDAHRLRLENDRLRDENAELQRWLEDRRVARQDRGSGKPAQLKKKPAKKRVAAGYCADGKPDMRFKMSKENARLLARLGAGEEGRARLD